MHDEQGWGGETEILISMLMARLPRRLASASTLLKVRRRSDRRRIVLRLQQRPTIVFAAFSFALYRGKRIEHRTVEKTRHAQKSFSPLLVRVDQRFLLGKNIIERFEFEFVVETQPRLHVVSIIDLEFVLLRIDDRGGRVARAREEVLFVPQLVDQLQIAQKFQIVMIEVDCREIDVRRRRARPSLKIYIRIARL